MISKQKFVHDVFMHSLNECVIRRGICPLVYTDDHERYCFAKDMPRRIIDMTDCPLDLKRRDW